LTWAFSAPFQLARHVLLLFESQAVGVVELEAGGAGDRAVFGLVLEKLLGHLEGGGVAMLFVFHDASDARDTFHHLGIGVAHVLGDEPGQLV
jgi:hypothetical protein